MPKSSKKKRENAPVFSMAGLIRYYEEEKAKVTIDPKILIIISIVFIVAIAVLVKIYP